MDQRMESWYILHHAKYKNYQRTGMCLKCIDRYLEVSFNNFVGLNKVLNIT